ncbi:MAG: molybdopterin converting factor subunit 1 [Pseudomonadota bacterium]|nr:molybdopterin converting factor subunit 1 [Pseudomonadota bacterium]
MQLLYFGWVRIKMGKDRENMDLPDGVANVRDLIEALRDRGAEYEEALNDISMVRVAVNQELTDLDAAVANDDEIALFPPMTGG